jgi:hypothetical protein
MAGRSVTPFDLYRANLAFALQLLSFGQEARQQTCEFEMRRIRRDLATAQAIRKVASTAHDWSELAVSCQTVARDYLASTTNLWQQGLGTAVRLQSGCTEGLREGLANWHSAWSDQWPTHTPMNPVVSSWQEWLQRLQSAATGMAGGRAAHAEATSRMGPADFANSAVSRDNGASADHGDHGDHHVG